MREAQRAPAKVLSQISSPCAHKGVSSPRVSSPLLHDVSSKGRLIPVACIYQSRSGASHPRSNGEVPRCSFGRDNSRGGETLTNSRPKPRPNLLIRIRSIPRASHLYASHKYVVCLGQDWQHYVVDTLSGMISSTIATRSKGA